MSEASSMPHTSEDITHRISRASVLSHHASSKFVEKNYEIEREVGRGAYGRVYLVLDRVTKLKRVCKVVNIDGMEEETLEMMKKETELLCQLDHPKVVKMYEYAIDEKDNELVMVIEYLSGGDGFDLLEKADGIPLREELVCKLAHQALQALCYCHSEGVVHRDIKPDNIMFTSPVDLGDDPSSPGGGLNCKLIDFGVAAHQDVSSRGLIGTAPYTAPEVAVFADEDNSPNLKNYTAKADLWSLGVTIFELLMDERPFPFDGNKMATLKFVRAYESFDELEMKFQKLTVWGQRSEHARSFLASLLVADPEQRLSATEALQHPWLRMYSGKGILGLPSHDHSLELPPVLPPLFSFTSLQTVRAMAGYQDAPAVMRCCLFVIAARLGAPDLEQFGKTFLKIDSDGDGKVTREEFSKALSTNAVFAGMTEMSDILEALDAADLDHSGDISFTEFVALCLYSRSAIQESCGDTSHRERLVRQAFLALDDDRDGLVTSEQLRAIFQDDCPLFDLLPQDRPFNIDQWISFAHDMKSATGYKPRMPIVCPL